MGEREKKKEVGCLLHCLYEDDDNVSIRVFDESSCCTHYHGDDSSEDSDNNEGQL
jgi:hypothetical protein